LSPSWAVRRQCRISTPGRERNQLDTAQWLVSGRNRRQRQQRIPGWRWLQVNSGDTYSFGAGTDSERAFGTLQSSSLVSRIGAQLRNDSGLAVTEITVNYTGEQWRLGATGRADTLKFEYSANATGLNDPAANWTPALALDFDSPTTTGATGALDGNASANRTAISAAINGLNVAPNATLWVRWSDVGVAGSDDGLAIDDVSFSVDGEPPVDNPPQVSSTVPANNAGECRAECASNQRDLQRSSHHVRSVVHPGLLRCPAHTRQR
jgi:hypothetical protein